MIAPKTVFTRHLTRLLRDDTGTMTIFSVFMIITILAICGGAVDLMRHESTRLRLQATLDCAVLAAADLDQLQSPEVVVTDYVSKSGLDASLTGVAATGNGLERVVSAAAEMSLGTHFMRLYGIEDLGLSAHATAEERITNVEVSLVLDISGSMRWNNRMENMQEGAKGFVRKVLTDQSEGVTTLNLIPFAGQVNPGDIMFDYFRGERPKMKNENNGWGNGDQDAPGASLCTNNAENAEEGATDPTCIDGTYAAQEGLFSATTSAISHIVLYFDTNGDDLYDVAHKIDYFPEDAPRDLDEIYEGAVAFVFAQDWQLTDPNQFLGIAINTINKKTMYYQVKGDSNGPSSDIGPTKNTGKIANYTFDYTLIDFAAWAPSYVAPDAVTTINVNMPSSCVEIASSEFNDTNLPVSDAYVPIFQYWPMDESVMDWGWCPEDDTAIQYYSDDAEALAGFIDGLRMHDGTGIQYGMKYALALLDPNTRVAVDALIDEGLVNSAFRDRPIAWNDAETEKYVVLMTDGQVTDQYRPIDPLAAINGEEDLETQGSAAYDTVSTQSENLANLLAQCQLARDNGVTVFTIAFETTEAAAADMRACASSESHFFHVNGSEIIETFDVIARQINNLRLIQ